MDGGIFASDQSRWTSKESQWSPTFIYNLKSLWPIKIIEADIWQLPLSNVIAWEFKYYRVLTHAHVLSLVDKTTVCFLCVKNEISISACHPNSDPHPRLNWFQPSSLFFFFFFYWPKLKNQICQIAVSVHIAVRLIQWYELTDYMSPSQNWLAKES